MTNKSLSIEEFFEVYSLYGQHFHTKIKVKLRDGSNALVYKVLPANEESDIEYRQVKVLKGSEEYEVYLNGRFYRNINFPTSGDIVAVELGNIKAEEVLV